MKKNLKKILILLILFVLASAGYFTWSWMQLREDGAVYTSIEDANLPVAYVNILGRRMNELDGFVEDSQKAAGRGSDAASGRPETVGDDRQAGLPDYGDAV